MDRFLLTSAEDMKEVKDNSIDVVVSTLVLCSVRDVKQTLKEVHRVLATVCITELYRLFFRAICLGDISISGRKILLLGTSARRTWNLAPCRSKHIILHDMGLNFWLPLESQH